ncbi:MAG: hypothetical protein KA419_16055 [Acidobacteria bacterium]|nr:hypothetical protein [Acidobacteriota bacterium]
MHPVFPEPVTALPEADIPLPGLKAFLLQGENQQLLFMAFAEEVRLPEHAHAAQFEERCQVLSNPFVIFET